MGVGVGTGILLVLEINISCAFIEDHILKDAAKPDGLPDFGLLTLLEADALCIAAALYVENAVIRPTMLISRTASPQSMETAIAMDPSDPTIPPSSTCQCMPTTATFHDVPRL